MEMRANNAQTETEFGGHFNSHGGSQIMGNSFSTSGGPIYFDSSSDNRLPTSICELPSYILSSHFTGRDNEIRQIDRVFGTSSGDLPARCVVHGMHGVGKTQLALRYATLAFERSRDMYTFWVSAGSVDKLVRDFARLVDLLHLPNRNTMDQGTKLTMAREWLEDPTTKKKWLVVLDNVAQETVRTLLDDILPRRNSGGRLLLTTRTTAIAELCAIPGKSLMITLQPPGTKDAVAMLAAGAGIDGGRIERAEYTDLERLVHGVGNLPLAIDQAASYLKGYESSAKNLLDLYQSEDVMEILSWENDLSPYEEKSVVATFMPVFNRISQTAPDALTLLRIFCFCDPERIPISILEQGCRALSQEDRRNIPTAIAEAVDGLFRSSIRLRKAIQEIQRLSLAVYTMKGSEGIVRIHDLVQLLLRSKLVATAERRQWLEMVIYVVCTAFKRIGDRRSPQNWSQCSQFVSHIEFMEGFAEQYGLHNTMLLDANMWAAIYLNECGLYEKAADIHRRIYERRKAALGEEHPKTLTSLSNLARVYSYQGRWKEAKVLFTGLMETWERVLGEEYPGTLRSISNLAAVYREQGHWKESERLLVEVIETMKIVQGENHPDTLDSISSLASIYWEQGRWKEAESLVVGVIETWKIVRGEHHPDTLGSISSLGAIYVGQRRWKEAEGLQNGVLETRKRVLGEEHPATLYSMNNLACIWKEQGQNAKAISLMGECVHLQTRILGASHHETLSSSAFLSEWQTQEPEVVSSASNSEDRTTKEERKRLDEGSDRAPH